MHYFSCELHKINDYLFFEFENKSNKETKELIIFCKTVKSHKHLATGII
jgi:hypothetical protein